MDPLLSLWQCQEGWGFAGLPSLCPIFSSIGPTLSSDYSHIESTPTITSSDKVSTDSRSVSLLDPSIYCQAFWNLISAPFKPLSSSFMTGSSSPGPGFLLQSDPTYRFCSLRCSCRWSFNTHRHTDTHTHIYSFLILRFYERTMVTLATLVVSLWIFFWKIDVLYCFFILGNIGLKRQKVSGRRNVPRRPWKYNLLSWQWAKYLLSLLGLSFPLPAAFIAFEYIKHLHHLHVAQPLFWSSVLGQLTAAHSVLLFAQLDMSDRMSSSLQRWA